jgi:hypothetical protein
MTIFTVWTWKIQTVQSAIEEKANVQTASKYKTTYSLCHCRNEVEQMKGLPENEKDGMKV